MPSGWLRDAFRVLNHARQNAARTILHIAEQRVTDIAVSATRLSSALVGGMPAYLGWLDPDLTFAENVRQVVLDPGSQFSAEPTLLIYDEVREPQPHLAILKAIGAGVKRKKGATKPTTDEQPAHTGNPG